MFPFRVGAAANDSRNRNCNAAEAGPIRKFDRVYSPTKLAAIIDTVVAATSAVGDLLLSGLGSNRFHSELEFVNAALMVLRWDGRIPSIRQAS
jgi:hypothetical protein